MRKFLVVLDDSRECLNAMRFAAMRAANTGGGVQILSIIPPEEFNHWIGVGEMMREEARERIHAHFEVFAKWMRDRQGVDPELVIREGEAVPEIIAHLSRYYRLEPGDLIYTGTPDGVGAVRSGDRIEGEVEGVASVVLHID